MFVLVFKEHLDRKKILNLFGQIKLESFWVLFFYTLIRVAAKSCQMPEFLVYLHSDENMHCVDCLTGIWTFYSRFSSCCLNRTNDKGTGCLFFEWWRSFGVKKHLSKLGYRHTHRFIHYYSLWGIQFFNPSKFFQSTLNVDTYTIYANGDAAEVLLSSYFAFSYFEVWLNIC